jgi:hypothetical protein
MLRGVLCPEASLPSRVRDPARHRLTGAGACRGKTLPRGDIPWTLLQPCALKWSICPNFKSVK